MPDFVELSGQIYFIFLLIAAPSARFEFQTIYGLIFLEISAR